MHKIVHCVKESRVAPTVSAPQKANEIKSDKYLLDVRK